MAEQLSNQHKAQLKLLVEETIYPAICEDFNFTAVSQAEAARDHLIFLMQNAIFDAGMFIPYDEDNEDF